MEIFLSSKQDNIQSPKVAVYICKTNIPVYFGEGDANRNLNIAWRFRDDSYLRLILAVTELKVKRDSSQFGMLTTHRWLAEVLKKNHDLKPFLSESEIYGFAHFLAYSLDVYKWILYII